MFISGNLKVEEDPQKGLKRLLEDVIYKDHRGRVFIIPKGYETDYASVPRCISWLLPKDSVYRNAAVVHDYLITDILIKYQEIESNRVDEIFVEAMADLGVPWIRRMSMWAGVRLGAIGNKRRRKGSLRTLPKVLGIGLLIAPFVAVPSIIVQIALLLIWLITLPLPRRQRVDAQKA